MAMRRWCSLDGQFPKNIYLRGMNADVRHFMLLQASISDLRSGKVSRDKGYIVITMRKYPQGIARVKINEWCKSLAPETELLEAFLSYIKKNKTEHNEAFDRVEYENRFRLFEKDLLDLKRLSDLSRNTDVYLLCQCR